MMLLYRGCNDNADVINVKKDDCVWMKGRSSKRRRERCL